jgi:hypothetical protein
MKKLVLLAFATLLLAGTSEYKAQDCFQYVRFCPSGKKEGFFYNGQSKSGAFATGDTTEVTMIAYKGMDYRVSACAEELSGEVQFRIVERVKKPYYEETKVKSENEKLDLDGNPIYDEEGNPEMEVSYTTVKKRRYKVKEIIRFDSQKDGVEFSFMSDQTRKLYIEVIVPGGGEGDGLMAEDGVQVACIGLLIEHRKGVRMGFGK